MKKVIGGIIVFVLLIAWTVNLHANPTVQGFWQLIGGYLYTPKPVYVPIFATNQGEVDGTFSATPAAAMSGAGNLSTSGSSTTVTVNSADYPKMQIGTMITANSIVHYVTSLLGSPNVQIGYSEDWSAGYSYTYQSPVQTWGSSTGTITAIAADGTYLQINSGNIITQISATAGIAASLFSGSFIGNLTGNVYGTVTTPKVSGTPGESCVYEGTTNSTNSVCVEGPAALSGGSYLLQYPAALPSVSSFLTISSAGAESYTPATSLATPTIASVIEPQQGSDLSVTSNTPVFVDSTNLKYTATVPSGSKMTAMITGVGAGGTTSALYVCLSEDSQAATVACAYVASTNRVPFSINYVFPGDGASHSWYLSASVASSNAGTISETNGKFSPAMIFRTEVSN